MSFYLLANLRENTREIFERCWIDLSASFKVAFTFLMVSSLFIATTGFFQTYIGYILLGTTPNIVICIAVFLMTFSVYSLDKLTDSSEDAINMPERRSFLSSHRKFILCYSLASYGLAVLLILIEKPLAVPIIFIPLVANALYGSRLFPGMRRLKEVPVVKNLVVAASWALITTLLPATDTTIEVSRIVAVVFYFMFAKVFINAVLYDIRDVEGDREMGVKTIPVLLGSWNTTKIMLVINSTLFSLLVFFGNSLRALAAAMIIYGYVYILYFSERKSPISLDFFVDGQWMIAAVLLPILKDLIGLA